MDIKIEQGIPVPERYAKQSTSMRQTLLHMKSGDSIVIKTVSIMSWRGIAYRYGIPICCRKLNDTESRLWRTE